MRDPLKNVKITCPRCGKVWWNYVVRKACECNRCGSTVAKRYQERF